jgi:hypothetical protein
MAEIWGASLGDEPMETSVVVDEDGAGRIIAHSLLADGARRDLTSSFTHCVDGLWAVLDSIVDESVEMFSVLHSPRFPGKSRFFPVADSETNFEALLEQSCIDGVLPEQAGMIYACQPFHDAAPLHRAEPYRRALRYLVNWENALSDGAQVGAWATPHSPQVLVRPPLSVDSLIVKNAGELGSCFVVADFGLSSYKPGESVEGQAGTYVDLGFAAAFEPAELDDTFESRLIDTFDAVTRLLLTFTAIADRKPGAKRTLSSQLMDSPFQWRDASREGAGWATDELQTLAASESGFGVIKDSEQLAFLVSTPDGVFERVIPLATPLRALARNGLAAEMAVQDAASTWGLPDFVFSPLVERKGSGVREVGDGLVVAGNRGAIIQVKTRETEPRNAERESSWTTKQIKAACAQVKGTARRVGAGTTNMVNGRGRTISIDGAAIEWVGVVVIEHPEPPVIKIDRSDIGLPYVVLVRRDWEFLFGQLRSTYAVIEYLHRVGEPTDVLGEEPHRYFELARADSLAESRHSDPRLQDGKFLRSKPLLPTEPVGDQDHEAHGFVRRILEDIATSPLGEATDERRQGVLASIDSLPVAHRTELGDLLLAGLKQAQATPSGKYMWRSRIFLSEEDRDQLCFAVCSEPAERAKLIFTDWVRIRHDQRREFENINNATSVGVLITPRGDGFREWDTTMMAIYGDPMLTDDDRDRFHEQWGKG